jgi:transposase
MWWTAPAADAPTHPGDKCVTGAFGRVRALRLHRGEGTKELLAIVEQDDGSLLPVDAYASLTVLAAQLQAAQTIIRSLEKRIVAQHRSNEASKRLEIIPSIGVIGATTIAAIVPDSRVFRSGPADCRRMTRSREEDDWSDLSFTQL